MAPWGWVLPPMRLLALEIAPVASSMSRVVALIWRPTSSYCWRMLVRFSSACRQSASAAFLSASVALSPRASKAFWALLASRVALARSIFIWTRVLLRRSSSRCSSDTSVRNAVIELRIPTTAWERLSLTLMATLASGIYPASSRFLK